MFDKYRSVVRFFLVSFFLTRLLDPNYTLVYNSRGNLYVNTGDLDKAIEDFEMVSRLNSDHIQTRRDLEWLRRYYRNY